MKTPARTPALPLFITLLAAIALTAPGCSDDGDGEDLELVASDFECILDWPQVGRYRVLNKLGHQEEAEAVARSADGGEFPVGTILQLVPNEAMVKRHAGFSPETSDWEFFFLEVSADGDNGGTAIVERGTTEVKNGFGGSCIGCHSEARPEFDLVCADDHGCEPLPVSVEEILAFQNSDPRCQ